MLRLPRYRCRATRKYVAVLRVSCGPCLTRACACCTHTCLLSPKRYGSISIAAAWPRANEQAIDNDAEQDFGLLQEVIIRIRDARNQMNVEPARRVPVILAAGSYMAMLEAQASLIEFLARTEKPQLYEQLDQKPEQAMSMLVGPAEVYL